MSKKVRRVPVILDAGEIKDLPQLPVIYKQEDREVKK